MTHDELMKQLKDLKLKAIREEFANLARLAEKESHSFEQYLYSLCAVELESRMDVRVKNLIKDSKIPYDKNIESFDFSNVQGVSSKEISRLASGKFINEAMNIVLYGGIGIGKTHMAIGLIKKLCEKGFKCLFISTSKLIENLLEAKKQLSIGQLWKKLDRFDLIACDELGYIPESKDGSDLFFQFISQRYERKSILITTNLTYSEWDKVFLNQITTAAAVDRIIHKCETFVVKGPSWRKEEARKSKKIKDMLKEEMIN